MNQDELEALEDRMLTSMDRVFHRVDKRTGKVDFDNVDFHDVRKVCQLAFEARPESVRTVEVVKEVATLGVTDAEKDVRAAASLFLDELGKIPAGRYLALATTSLEQAVLWAVEAIRKEHK